MKYDKYEEILGRLTTENAPAIMTEIKENIKTDIAEYDAMIKKMTEQENKINELRDTNMKLFLSQTGGSGAPDEEKEKTPEDYRNELINELKGV